jgi:hypothetical protein
MMRITLPENWGAVGFKQSHSVDAARFSSFASASWVAARFRGLWYHPRANNPLP